MVSERLSWRAATPGQPRRFLAASGPLFAACGPQQPAAEPAVRGLRLPRAPRVAVSQALAGFERRRSERIPVPARGGAISVVGARVVNVSAHGMLIESLVPMERELILTLRVVVAG